MLRIENLTVNYGHVQALKGISLNVKKGEIITLIGGNGAGKSTTLMAISHLTDNVKGHIFFKDTEITRMHPEKIVKMGISHVPEGRKIFPTMTVQNNLLAGTFGNPELKKDKIDFLLENVYKLFPRLEERLKQMGGSLSGGEQQMLAIGRGLMMDPELIMLDEPSLGLAPILVEEIFEMVKEVRDQGKTVLLIEQNASMALSIADRGYVLETGTITLSSTGKELLKNEAVKKAYLGG